MKRLAVICLGLAWGAAPALAAESEPGPDVLPQPVFEKSPAYPYSLRLSGNSGEVFVDFLVDVNGEVRNPIVLRSSHPDFEGPAVEALLQWRFKPGLKAGQPVATHMQLPFLFGLDPGNGIEQGVSPFEVPRKPSKNLPPEFQYDEPPRPVLTSAPVYPFALLQQNLTGSATVAFAIDPQGRPRNVVVRAATRPEFGAAAAAMIAAWQFAPAKKAGQPSWALLSYKQVFDRTDRDTPFNESAARLLDLLGRGSPAVIQDLGELDAKPRARYQPGPVIPEALAQAHVGAEAEIECIIDHAGRTQLPRIVSSSREDFGWAAATAVARWQFTPPTKGGRPVDVQVRIPVGFEPAPGPAAR